MDYLNCIDCLKYFYRQQVVGSKAGTPKAAPPVSIRKGKVLNSHDDVDVGEAGSTVASGDSPDSAVILKILFLTTEAEGDEILVAGDQPSVSIAAPFK